MTQRDWEAFVLLAVERHRVAPSVQTQLAEITPPERVQNLINAATQANALQVLQQIRALRVIRQAFEAADMAFVVLKGWPLAEQVFGNNSARQARDIDLLIDPTLIRPAAKVLNDLGYQPDQEHPEHFRMLGSKALMGEFNNLSFKNAETNLMVELHWRCHQFTGWPELFPNGHNLDVLQTSIGNVTVPAEQQNLLYLAIHGSLHRWARLKWLCDIAALAERRGVEQLGRDVEVAKSIGAARPLELSLYLAGLILNAPCPQTRFDGGSWLPRQCLSEIARAQAVPTGISQRLKFYTMMLTLAEGAGQHLGVFRYRLWGKNRLALADFRRMG